MSNKEAAPAAATPHTVTVALLTVCVDPLVAEQLMQSVAAKPWSLECLEFDSYMSPVMRPQLSPEAKNAQALIAVIDFDTDPEQALETTAYLQRSFFGRIAIVSLARNPDAALLRRAMRAGCTEVLDKPFDPAQFHSTLTRLEEHWAASTGKVERAGQILSFFGAKGGVGTTTVAMHLAIFLVLSYKKKVLLIDNHRDLGHVCLYLGLDGTRYHFKELIRNVGRLDSDLLQGFIATHKSGLHVLSSPDVYEEQGRAEPEPLLQTLRFLRGEYDFVIVDCHASAEESDLAVMEMSDYIYLVAVPMIGAIRDLSRYIDAVIQKGQRAERLHIVMNRYLSQSSVSVEHIEKAVRLPVEIKICNYYAECTRAANVGSPITPDQKSEFTAQFAAWAASLAGPGEARPTAPGRKRLTWLR
jgi:pilus assembly protein CpaE